MDRRRTLLLTVALGSLPLAGCFREPLPPALPADGDPRYRICLQGEELTTKSTLYASADKDAVRAAACAVYKDGFKVLSFDGMRSEDDILLETASVYSVYAMAGDVLIREGFPERESDLEGLRASVLNAAGDGIICRDATGPYIPMAACLRGTPGELDEADGTADGVITLPLERLFAEIRFKGVQMDPADEFLYLVSLVEFSVWNGATEVFPFSQKPANQVFTGRIDHCPEGTADGERFVLVPENLQGRLLPRNNDPYHKSETVLRAEGLPFQRCTYVQAKVKFRSLAGIGGTVTYRFYPGDDVSSDFSIRRNTRYDISLTLTREGTELKDVWMVDSYLLKDSRSLRLHGPLGNVPPGGTAYLACEWTRDERTYLDFTTNYGTRYGWMVGTDQQNASFLAGGEAQLWPVTQGYALQCPSCEHLFPGWEEGQTAEWADAFLRQYCTGDAQTLRKCRRCGFTIVGAESSASFRELLRGRSPYQTACGVASFPVPADAAPGTTIDLTAITFDGKKRSRLTLSVGTAGGNAYWWSGEGVPLIGCKDVLTASPTDGLTGVHYSVAPGSEALIRVADTSAGADNVSCSISAIGSGVASLQVTGVSEGGQSVDCGTYSFVIERPVLRLGSSTFRLPYSGEDVALDPAYYAPAGNRLEESYFDSALYAELLTPQISLAEGSPLQPFVAVTPQSARVAVLESGGQGIPSHAVISQIQAVPRAESLRRYIHAEASVSLDLPFAANGPSTNLGAIDNIRLLLEAGDNALARGRMFAYSVFPDETLYWTRSGLPLSDRYRIPDIVVEDLPDMSFEVAGAGSGFCLTPHLKNAPQQLSAGVYSLRAAIRHRDGALSPSWVIGKVYIYLHTFFGASLREGPRCRIMSVRPHPPGTDIDDFYQNVVTFYDAPNYEVSFTLADAWQGEPIPALVELKASLEGVKALLHKRRWNNTPYGSEWDKGDMEMEVLAAYTRDKEYVPRNIFTTNPYGYLDSLILIGPTHRYLDGGTEIRRNKWEWGDEAVAQGNVRAWSSDYETVFTTRGYVAAPGDPVYAIRLGHWRPERFWPAYGLPQWECFRRDFYPTLRIDTSRMPATLGTDVNGPWITYHLTAHPYHVLTVSRNGGYTWSAWTAHPDVLSY